VVVGVKAGSTAEEIGVREGDIILEVNRKTVSSLRSYEQAASGLAKDQAVLLLIKRKGQTIYLTLRP
jgi:serine protease Do